jgi:hypothetical protein
VSTRGVQKLQTFNLASDLKNAFQMCHERVEPPMFFIPERLCVFGPQDRDHGEDRTVCDHDASENPDQIVFAGVIRVVFGPPKS